MILLTIIKNGELYRKYGNENHVEVKITSYGSGSQLLLNYQKRKFDVIFLDVSMPEMDGFETAEEIRRVILMFQSFLYFLLYNH